MLLGPGGINILLLPFVRRPIYRCRGLFDQVFFVFMTVPPKAPTFGAWDRYDAGVNQLATASDLNVLSQLTVNGVNQQ
jgi:hypothetical protein